MQSNGHVGDGYALTNVWTFGASISRNVSEKWFILICSGFIRIAKFKGMLMAWKEYELFGTVLHFMIKMSLLYSEKNIFFNILHKR